LKMLNLINSSVSQQMNVAIHSDRLEIMWCE
jgi:hypothetical protein